MTAANLWRKYAIHISLLALVLGWMLVVASALATNVGTMFLAGLAMGSALMVLVREVRRS